MPSFEDPSHDQRCLPRSSSATTESPRIEASSLSRPQTNSRNRDGIRISSTASSARPGSRIDARTISPMSFSSNGRTIGGGVADDFLWPTNGCLTAFSGNDDLDRADPNVINAPITWSEMVPADLINNLCPRERARQEILWEVVASEERFVTELESMIVYYVQPLFEAVVSARRSSVQLVSREPTPVSDIRRASQNELPIAARYLRAIRRSSFRSATLLHDLAEDLPEIHDQPPHSPETPGPDQEPVRGPETPVTEANGRSGRLSRLSLKEALANSPFGAMVRIRPRRSEPPEEITVPPLPEPLRETLEALVDLRAGHQALCITLKDHWVRSFPLVRELAAVWSDQAWFLDAYARYIRSLERTLATIDDAITISGRPLPTLGTSVGRSEHERRQLGYVLRVLEKHASEAGESSLGICVSKPLMRLGKMPLLMQNLLYHTEALSHEWEATRRMARQVDELVKTIESHKVDEDERIKVRDVYARIENIADKAFMAPGSPRVLLEERPATGTDTATRLRHPKSSAEWLVLFSDVTIRCRKIGITRIPVVFTELQTPAPAPGPAKRKKVLPKMHPARNLYRFVRIEEWADNQTRVRSPAAGETTKAAAGAAAMNSPTSDEADRTSVMSFAYETNEPKDVPKFGTRLRSTSGEIERPLSLSRRLESPSTAGGTSRSRVGFHPATPSSPRHDSWGSSTKSPSILAHSISTAPTADTSLDVYETFWKADSPMPIRSAAQRVV